MVHPKLLLGGAAGVLLGVAVTASLAANAESDNIRTIPYGGYVDFDGKPVNASNVEFNFAIYPCATPGTGIGQCQPLWLAKGTWSNGWPAGQFVTLPIFAGRFTVELGAAGQNPLPEEIFYQGNEVLYLGMQLEGRALGALQKITPATRAISASEADRLRVRGAIDFDGAGGGAVSVYADAGLVVDGALSVNDSLTVAHALTVDGEFGLRGRTPMNPGRSCKAIRAAVPTSGDGIYWISPDDGAAFQVACDMTHGGLTFASFERGAKRPVAWWNMETTTPDGNIEDLVGSNDLTLHGAPLAGQPGRQGLSYHIGTTEDFFVSKSGFAPQLLGPSAKSVSAWVRVPSFAGTQGHAPLVSFGGAGLDGGSFCIDITDGVEAYFIGTSRDQDGGAALTVNTWHHLVATFDSRMLRLYVDGQSTFQGPKALSTGMLNGFDRYVVGADSWWSTTIHRLGLGDIDEAKVYDYALDPNEVRELFVLGARGAD